MRYDVFISYRRQEGRGLEIARIIDSQLDKTVWYRSFLDYNELKDEEWSPKIFKAIDSAPVFLFVLTVGSLDRCIDEADCVRQEILYAIEKNKHIVPVNPDGKVKWNEIDKKIREKIPEEIRKALFDNQQSEISLGQLFNPSIRKLVKERIKPYVPRVILLKKLVYSAIALLVIALLFALGIFLKQRNEFKKDYTRYKECIENTNALTKKDPYSKEAVYQIVEADSLARKYKYSRTYYVRFGDDSELITKELFERHKNRAEAMYSKFESHPSDYYQLATEYVNLALKLGEDDSLENKKRWLSKY